MQKGKSKSTAKKAPAKKAPAKAATKKETAVKVESPLETKSKDLDITKTEETSNGTLVCGNPDLWVCLAKTSNESEGWMKSTKVMQLGNGCLVQVTTQQGDNVTEALTFAPGAKLRKVNGNYVFS